MKKLVDKTIDPIKALQAGNLTFAVAQQMYNGVIPIGDDEGKAVAYDINKQVKQPLVWAEQLHILGILDGRLATYDQCVVPVLTPVAAYTGTLTVPAGQVWYITAVESILPNSGGVQIISANWHCSLWPDPAATPSTHGQPFHGAAFNFGFGGGTQWDEFAIQATWWTFANKPYPLRLPAGTVLTFVANQLGAGALTAAVNAVFNLYGYIGKPLVD